MATGRLAEIIHALHPLTGDVLENLIDSLCIFKDGSQLQALYGQHTWIEKLLRQTYPSSQTDPRIEAQDAFMVVVDDALVQLHADPAIATQTLVSALEMIAGGILYHLWSKYLGTFQKSSRMIFRKSGVEWQKEPRWQLACVRVSSCCLRAGVANVTKNPFENIDQMRTNILFHVREKKLVDDLADLRQQLTTKDQELATSNRVVTALSFRHLLEHLTWQIPARFPNDTPSAR